MQAKPMRQANSNAFVVLQPLIISPDGAVDQSQDQALEGIHGVVHQDSIQGPLPLEFTSRDLVEIGLFTRQGSDAEHKVELRKFVAILHLVRAGNEFFVDAEKSRLVEDGKQG